MSATVHELIGQIIDPRPTSPAPAPSATPALPAEPVEVLIGRIIAPPARRAAEPAVEAPAERRRPLAIPFMAIAGR